MYTDDFVKNEFVIILHSKLNILAQVTSQGLLWNTCVNCWVKKTSYKMS